MTQIAWIESRWLPALVATPATFFLGAPWYSALFGKRWVALQGFDAAKVAALKRARPPAVFPGTMLIAYFVLCWVLAWALSAAGVAGWRGGALCGFTLWLGFAATIRATDAIATDKPLGLHAIDAGYQLAFLVMDGAILGAWR